MIETKYKILEYKGEELKHFEIKFRDSGAVHIFYKGEEIKRVLEMTLTPQKLEIRTSDVEVKNE